MSLRHLLTLPLALRAKEFSDPYSRALCVLSNRVPRTPRGSRQAVEGAGWIMGRVSSPVVHLVKLFSVSHTGFPFGFLLNLKDSKAEQQQHSYRRCSESLQIYAVSLPLGQKQRRKKEVR